MKKLSYSTLLRMSAIYDIVIIIPFILPAWAIWHIGNFSYIHETLSLSGTVPEFDYFHLLFVSLLATLVLTWSTLRVCYPMVILGLYDGVARLIFAVWMVIYITNFNVSGVIWFYFVPEVIWGILQLFGYWKIVKEQGFNNGHALKYEQKEALK